MALLLAGVVLLGLNGCTQEEEGALKSKIAGTWNYDKGSTAYNAGLLLNLSGHAQVIDTATVLETVNSLFSNSEVRYNADSTGSIQKDVLETSVTDTTTLAGILNGLAGQMLSKNFTYTAASGKIVMKMGATNYTFTVISVTDTQLNVSMPLTDLTKWMSALLGDNVSNITKSPIYLSITQIAAIVGVYASPTVTMTFNKRPKL